MAIEPKLKAGDQIARFVIESLAGRGGMGEVYRARDTENDQTVAVKILRRLDLESDDSLQKESFVLSAIEHPGIVRFIASGESTAGPYLAMEWLEGEKLSRRLQRGPLGISETIQLVSRVADALSVAHHRGFVHCDIKPGNIFLPNGEVHRVKLLDFGLAHQQSAVQSLSLSSGRIAGTPAYMAPEQARGQSEQMNPRADVFSLGCVFFECLTGQAAFSGKHMTAVLAKILFEEAPDISKLRSGIPREVEELIRKMLSKDASQRPRDAAEVAMILRDVGGTQNTSIKIALTQQEQQLISVIVVASSLKESDTKLFLSLREIAKRFGGGAELLADGAVVAMLSGQQAATDQARLAARCALQFREMLPSVTMAVTTGRGEAGPWPVGEAIERGVALSQQERRATILLDDATLGLLDERFVVNGKRLTGEREVWQESRTLLGKVAPFVGRDRELGEVFDCLSARLFANREGSAQSAWVIADAGVGKSRFARAVLEKVRAEKLPVTVWLSRGEQLRQGSPLGLLVPTLRRALALNEGEPSLVHQAKIKSRLRPFVSPEELSEECDFLGELVGVASTTESAAMQAARQDPRLMSERMLGAFLRFLSLEMSNPLLWVIEDMHWADQATAQFITAALKAHRNEQLFVLILARPEVEKQFGALFQDTTRQTFLLAGLSVEASRSLAKQVLGDGLSESLLQLLCERAAGNAFYLEELIRAVARGESSFPETVLAMAQNRLRALPANVRLLLRAASIFGQDFWDGGLCLLSTIERSEADEILKLLVQQEFIVRRQESRFAGEAEYTFRHALGREAASLSLTEQDRVLGHRLAGQWLEQHGETASAVIADHYLQGQLPEPALRFYLRAAREATEVNDLASAISHAEKGLECGAKYEARGEFCLLLAEIYNWKADFTQASEWAQEATQLLPEASEHWFRACAELGLAYRRLNQHEPLVELAKKIRSMKWNLENGPAPIIAASRISTGLAFAHQLGMAIEFSSRMEQCLEHFIDQPLIMALYQMTKAGVEMLSYDIGGFLFGALGSVEAFVKAGDKRNACSQRMDVGYTYSDLGFHQKAVEYLYSTMNEANALGMSRIPTGCRRPLSISLAYLGRFDDARREAKLAIEEFVKQGDLYQESGVRIYLARIEMMQGNISAAEEQVQLVLASLPPGATSRPAAMAAAARLALLKNQHEDAEDFINVAIQKFKPIGGVNVGESFIRLTYCEVMLATADPEIARAAVEASVQNIRERASKIKDKECRESFLKNLPENAGILALAKKLGIE